MPTYCYKTESGDVIERVFPIGEAPQLIDLGGATARRDFVSEMKGIPSSKGWPLECVASGVNAAQSGELREYLARSGVPTEVTPDGNPVYTCVAHRRRALKARGLFDRSSFV